MLTGETDAEVDEYSMNAVILPEPLSEDELASFMLQRTESGDLALEDIPVRLGLFSSCGSKPGKSAPEALKFPG